MYNITYKGIGLFFLSICFFVKAQSQISLQPIEPGNDYYRYINKAWLDSCTIPKDLPVWGGFTTLAIDNQLKLKGILEALASQKNLPKGSIEQKVGDLYASGMDTSTINHLTFKPLIPVLKRIDDVKNYKELLLLLAHLYTEGNGQLFGFSVAPDLKKSTINIVNFMQAGLTLQDKAYYLSEDETSKFIRMRLKAYMQQLLVLTGTPLDDAEAMAKEIMTLEIKIAASHLSKVDQRDPLSNYHKMSISKFQELTPHIDWNELFQIMGVQTDSINVAHPMYFKTLDSLLVSVSIETWKNKVKYVYINSKSTLLSQPFEDANFAFNQIFTGQLVQPERWKKIVNLSDGELLGSLYVKKYFTPKAKAKMDTMVDNLLQSFKNRIKKLDWMSDSTKNEALLKLSRITKKIGYPEKIKDYHDVQISRNDFFGNCESYLLHAYKESISKINKRVDKTEWEMTAPTVNAYYNPSNNEIVFPAGILQPPFFDINASEADNYGAIGMVISHEITHGFDDQGRRFDANGNLRDWWTKDDEQKFNSKKQVLINQYNAYKVLDSIPVNGQLTIGENIADLGGIAIAYDGYQTVCKQKQFNIKCGTKEMFFKSFATIWRSKARDNYAAMLIKMDTHSPDKFRVNGTLSNFSPFYATYHLTEKNTLYRREQDRVKIW